MQSDAVNKPNHYQAQRTRHAKVRTGCLTCKARRVKCDEQKPKCQRCVKAGHECRGYRYTPNQRLEQQPRVLIPRKGARVLNSPDNLKHLPLSLSHSLTSRFQNEDEGRYFQLFCTQTAYHLGSHYDQNLWNRIILQASEANTSIRHAVIAIGALEMTSNLGGQWPKLEFESLNSPTMTFVVEKRASTNAAEKHHLFALEQYSKAIKEIKDVLSVGKYDLRSALVASTLIICFERYHGNFETAMRQTRFSVRLLEEARANQTLKPTEVEEDLCRTLDRLDIENMSMMQHHSLEEHKRLKDRNFDAISSMPSSFADINEAHVYLNLVIRWALHFAAICYSEYGSGVSRQPVSEQGRALLREREELLAKLEQWASGYRPLHETARWRLATGKTGNEILAYFCLQEHWLVVFTSVKHIMHTAEVYYDTSLHLFEEMVEMAEVMLQGNDAVFTFSIQSIYAMDMVAKKCRNQMLRRKAINLLAKKPRREGFLDSMISAKVCWWIVQVEEAGMVNGYIPEEARARNIGVKVDSEAQQALVWCDLPGKEGSEVMRKQGVVASWDLLMPKTG